MALHVVALKDLLDNYSEESIQRRLEEFNCPLNEDVEFFLLKKAISFEKVGMARTTLVYASLKGELALAGYFSISNKPMNIGKKNWGKISNSVKKKLIPMGYRSEQENYVVPGILLGQFAKNSRYKDNNLIQGKELLSIAYKTIKKVWELSGGSMLYLEAENEQHLRDFYTYNGFSQLIVRKKEADSKPTIPYVTANGLHLYIKKLTDL